MTEGEAMRGTNRRQRLLAAAVAAALMAGASCAVTRASEADDAETFKTAYEAGKAARKAAAAVGFEWRDTKKMLRRAKKLAEKGEYEKAIELANKAKHQGEQGVSQAREQETAWKEAVLK